LGVGEAPTKVRWPGVKMGNLRGAERMHNFVASTSFVVPMYSNSSEGVAGLMTFRLERGLCREGLGSHAETKWPGVTSGRVEGRPLNP
jgi:hypothetical protein